MGMFRKEYPVSLPEELFSCERKFLRWKAGEHRIVIFVKHPGISSCLHAAPAPCRITTKAKRFVINQPVRRKPVATAITAHSDRRLSVFIKCPFFFGFFHCATSLRHIAAKTKQLLVLRLPQSPSLTRDFVIYCESVGGDIEMTSVAAAMLRVMEVNVPHLCVLGFPSGLSCALQTLTAFLVRLFHVTIAAGANLRRAAPRFLRQDFRGRG